MTGRLRQVVIVNDRMQRGYQYERIASLGRNFHPQFPPELKPKEMLELGVFCGKYMTEGVPSQLVHTGQVVNELPRLLPQLFWRGCQPTTSVWRKMGWIHSNDPRGWFQWYCRYYIGRRMPEEDARQIRRWKAIRRHLVQVRRNCEPGDQTCRPRQRQALLHWAYDSRKI